jgi:hypothetical protein
MTMPQLSENRLGQIVAFDRAKPWVPYESFLGPMLGYLYEYHLWCTAGPTHAYRMLRRGLILTAAIAALPTCSLAQVQSRVESRVGSRVDSHVDSRVRSRVESGLFNGFDRRQKHAEEQQHSRYFSSSCWRAIRMPNGVLTAWNCQPYPQP